MTSRENRSIYIVGPVYDWAFFLLPPLASLLVGVAISGSDFAYMALEVGGTETTLATLLLGSLVHGHLVAVVFRSHGNPDIFRTYPLRFTVVPIVLFIALLSSAYIAVAATVVATFWDVWHSGAQTFGFARIYDRNRGAPPEQGRRLDYWLNQLLYAGPILAGVTLMDHVESFGAFADVGDTFFSAVPAQVEGNRRWLTYGVLAAATLFLGYYLLAQWRFRRQGYRPPAVKVFLLVSTGLCSIYTWGFNTWGEAFFIMNLFHAVQYLALVWAVEHKRMARRLRLEDKRLGKPVTGLVFLGAVGAYGAWAELMDPSLETLWAVTMVVSLMHFWYDAFVWSVAKRQV